MKLSDQKLCCVFNLAPHYRRPIFELMDKTLKCDFYFGDQLKLPLKQLDPYSLKNFKAILKNRFILNTGYLWQKGAISIAFRPYHTFLLTGDPYILSNWVIGLIAKLRGKQTIIWTHGLKNGYSKKQKLFYKLFFRIFDQILLYGEKGKNALIKEGFSHSKLIPIYNSLDHSTQVNLRENLHETDIYDNHFHNSYPVIIFTGRIQKDKKLDQLVKALFLLHKMNLPCNLVIVGEDIQGVGLKNVVQELELSSNVWFTGPIYEESQLAELFFNAMVTVSPGPIGLTTIHSLVYGTPVITSDNFDRQGPEHEAIKTGVTGDFFKEDNIEDLANTIQKWIDHDAIDRRNKIRRDCYEIVDQKFNPEHQLKILETLLNRS